MINRTLIRLKVVQLLYAHLLTRTDFKVLKNPQRSTREATDSFNFYCKIIALLLVATSQNGLPASLSNLRDRLKRISVLRDDKMLAALAADSEMKETLAKNITSTEEIEKLAPKFIEKLEDSTAYKDYKRKRNIEIEDNIRFWETIIKTVLLPLLIDADTENPDFSRKAIENGCELAISTLKNYADLRVTFVEAKNALLKALEEAYNLYLQLLLLAVEITRERELQIDAAKNKYVPTAEDLNPDTKFIDNAFVRSLKENEDIAKYLKNNPVTWDTEPLFLKNMLSVVLSSAPYREYMAKSESSFADDCELWRKLFQDVIFPSDELAEAMESKSVYWNDDLNIMGTFVIKSIRQAARNSNEEPSFKLLPKYKDEEDSEFGIELFKKAVVNLDEYKSYIDKFVSSNWDPERIAFMDIVVMITAIAELINFPNIPLPVTMNEYTDIAADYSTPRSGQFVNGLLFSVSEELKKEHRIFK